MNEPDQGRARCPQRAASVNKLHAHPPRPSVPRPSENALASWSAALCAAFERTKALSISILLFLTLTGCSTFNKEWKTASTTPARGIEGPWSGEWRSEKNNHHGSLRAIITKTSPTTYRAHYRAKYMKILRFTYIATLQASSTNTNTNQNTVTLEGESNLGKLAGGIYTYQATATPTEFRSTYKSKYDHGHYELHRPPK